MTTTLPFGWNDVEGRWLFVHRSGCFDASGDVVEGFGAHNAVRLDGCAFDAAAFEREMARPCAPVVLSFLAAATSTMLLTTNRLTLNPCTLNLTPSDAALMLYLSEAIFDARFDAPGADARASAPTDLASVLTPVINVIIDLSSRDSSEALVRGPRIDVDMLRGALCSIVTFAHPDNRDLDAALMTMKPSLDVGLDVIDIWAEARGVSINPLLVANIRE